MKRRTKAELVLGGGEDEARRRFEPSVWRDVGEGDSLLEMEIFGPFLPIVPVEDINEAIEYINDQCVFIPALMVNLAYRPLLHFYSPSPLVLYSFTTDPKVKQARTSHLQPLRNTRTHDHMV